MYIIYKQNYESKYKIFITNHKKYYIINVLKLQIMKYALEYDDNLLIATDKNNFIVYDTKLQEILYKRSHLGGRCHYKV